MKLMAYRGFYSSVLALFLILNTLCVDAQETDEIVDYSTPDDYIVGGITVSGVRFLDLNVLIGLSGLRIGQEVSVPGEQITTAVKKLWQQGLFSDVRITVSRFVSDTVYLDIALQERPRISSIRFNGLKSSESKDITEKINMPVGSQLTTFLLNNTRKIITDHFVE